MGEHVHGTEEEKERKETGCPGEASPRPESEEINKEHKKALSNFRDQVRYKDYKGLVKTLQSLETLMKKSHQFVIPDKYAVKFNMVQENILLLKNIIISDIKCSIANDKALDKSIVVLSTLLSEKYAADVRNSIVTWVTNFTLAEETKNIEQLASLSGIEAALDKLLRIKDSVGIKTAHLPIWWNISKVVLSNMTTVVKNRVERLVEKNAYTDTEYLHSLALCIDFEKTYLSGKRQKHTSPQQEISALQLSTSSPTHLQLLEDISQEQPLFREETSQNGLSAALVPRIDIYVASELSGLAEMRIVFEGNGVHPSVYEVYTLLTQTLSKLIYFKYPEVGQAFLQLVDASVSRTIRKSTFSNSSKHFVSGLETVEYIHTTTLQMLQRLEQIFFLTDLDAPKTFDALGDLSNRIFASLSVSLEKRLFFLNRAVIHEQRLEQFGGEVFTRLTNDISAISLLVFSNKQEVLEEWLNVLGQAIFNGVVPLKLQIHHAADILSFMTALEVSLRQAISESGFAPCLHPSMIDSVKIYLKVFLVSSTNPKDFAENYQTISNGLFTFHQILAKTPKKHRKPLIDAFNALSAQSDTPHTSHTTSQPVHQ
ncbi:hypothetical protein NEDG_01343 [Nematocida displodere]|uniref:Exocyst complex component Sec8 n=1 Tax=Nematocida displodere TaxID=1805483 RepID=A0A177ED05_9MICR|nr:hypothetical protein NEDG_01343 [Nematocida displodere]